jgi:hypothetical protein
MDTDTDTDITNGIVNKPPTTTEDVVRAYDRRYDTVR